MRFLIGTSMRDRTSLNMRHCLIYCGALLALSCAATLSLKAEVLHVATSGKAGAKGTADESLASVQEALDRAKAGDLVRLKAGVYRARVAFKNSGEHGKPVTLEGEPG